ncbi:sugar phosphate isomerase/epimerase family protein [Oceanobacillus polygoni]|uniref:Sugar phosphate isomerase/epimerase n=1 Tax=Oceanobacillus polygoni TaxID=1235259 RepID=A0A9X0YTH4_9BACI|nr:sugar phosphate isomerase/epimerase family protein [Oceanobacillus polygoni]MBP2076874.1 sugar phosphate isomerase/epimerase [Oceanobacillus polygoni]
MTFEICYSENTRLTKDVKENVLHLIEHGAETVELFIDGSKWELTESQFEEMAAMLKELPVQYTVHPPAFDINLTSENKAVRETAFSEYKKSIQFAGMIDASHVVIHPGFCFSSVFDKQVAQERAIVYIKQLSAIAKENHVKLAIENVGYNGSSIFTQEEFTVFLDKNFEHDESVGYLIDVGHALLNQWDIPKLIADTKHRLLALHLHDNNGTSDDHLPIYEGKMEWEAIFNTIREEEINCEFILEYDQNIPLEKLREGKEIIRREIFG